MKWNLDYERKLRQVSFTINFEMQNVVCGKVKRIQHAPIAPKEWFRFPLPVCDPKPRAAERALFLNHHFCDICQFLLVLWRSSPSDDLVRFRDGEVF
jgi:hypothetical protein